MSRDAKSASLRVRHFAEAYDGVERWPLPWLVTEAYRLSYWLGLPWRCRLRHAMPVRRASYEYNTGCLEEAWLECPRCTHWFGWAPDDPFGRGGGE